MYFLEIWHLSSSPTYRIFLCNSFPGYLHLKGIYISHIFSKFKIIFLILKYSPKNHEVLLKMQQIGQVFLAITLISKSISIHAGFIEIFIHLQHGVF